jgi:branched-chain amino acid aminotransferase
MIIYLNGKFVPEEQAVVSVLDRGILYGDGLFEAIRVSNGQVFRWKSHLERLESGAAFLKIKIPVSREELLGSAWELIRLNDVREGVLRIVLTRGTGQRGYSPKGANQPTLVLSMHPVQEDSEQGMRQWRLQTTHFQVHPGDRVSQFKTCNKLVQVLARAEAEEAGANEGVLLTPEGLVAEATSGNIFWIQKGEVRTPPLQEGVLPGITRSIILELCDQLKVSTAQSLVSPQGLSQAEGVFVSLTSWGMVVASHIDGNPIGISSLTARLHSAYHELLIAETRK